MEGGCGICFALKAVYDLEVEHLSEGSVLGNVDVEVLQCAVVDQGIVVFVVFDVTGGGDVVFKGGEVSYFSSLWIVQSCSWMSSSFPPLPSWFFRVDSNDVGLVSHGEDAYYYRC